MTATLDKPNAAKQQAPTQATIPMAPTLARGDLVTTAGLQFPDAWRVVANPCRKSREIDGVVHDNVAHMTLRNLETNEQRTFHERDEQTMCQDGVNRSYHVFVKLVRA